MAEYTVIKPFMDLQDNRHIYRAGDKYPRPGYMPTDERINDLMTGNNKHNHVYIEGDEPVKEPVKETKKLSKTEIMRLPVAKLRSLAAEMGLENPEEMIGSELKEWILSR